MQVPDKWEDNRILSNWVKKQREQHDLLVAGKNNQMNIDRKAALDDIGFDYTGAGGWGDFATTSTTVAAAPPAMPGAPLAMAANIMPPSVPTAPAVPTDATQMTFEQQIAAMQAMSF